MGVVFIMPSFILYVKSKGIYKNDEESNEHDKSV
jgi:hypothetical protein